MTWSLTHTVCRPRRYLVCVVKNKNSTFLLLFQIVVLHEAWRSGSHSPLYRTSSGALSPDWASPPFPGSPLSHRRTARVGAAQCVGGDGPPLGSVTSFSPASPISLESETERLIRWVSGEAQNVALCASKFNMNNSVFLLICGGIHYVSTGVKIFVLAWVRQV